MHERSISADAVRAVFTETGTRPGLLTRVVPAMGSRATITVVGGAEALLDGAAQLLAQCEAVWSRFEKSSDISRLNWAEGEAIVVNPLTLILLERMAEGSQLTAGDFDPTLLPDLLVAGYATSAVNHERTTTLPGSAVAPGNLAGIRTVGSTVSLPIGTTLDAGGIGKGLAADLVCQYVLANGGWGVMAEIGGDIVVDGEAPDGVAWRLGVENPHDVAAHSSIVRLRRGALVTSSQRKKRFATADGTTHHLINPRTHSSATTTVQTVSVIATSGARAETLTKPGFVRPPSEYLAWLPTVGAAGLVIDEAGVATVSENWENYQ
jgi:thiamine biosynthesis lipoprotein